MHTSVKSERKRQQCLHFCLETFLIIYLPKSFLLFSRTKKEDILKNLSCMGPLTVWTILPHALSVLPITPSAHICCFCMA